MRGQALFDLTDPRELTDVMLRAGAPPSVDARQAGASLDAENGREFLRGQLDQLVVGQIDRSGIVRPADERPDERRPGRRAMRPFRRDPRARGDANPIGLARHDEAGAAQGVSDRRSRPGQCDAGTRRIGNVTAEIRNARLNRPKEIGRHECRTREHDAVRSRTAARG